MRHLSESIGSKRTGKYSTDLGIDIYKSNFEQMLIALLKSKNIHPIDIDSGIVFSSLININKFKEAAVELKKCASESNSELFRYVKPMASRENNQVYIGRLWSKGTKVAEVFCLDYNSSGYFYQVSRYLLPNGVRMIWYDNMLEEGCLRLENLINEE